MKPWNTRRSTIAALYKKSPVNCTWNLSHERGWRKPVPNLYVEQHSSSVVFKSNFSTIFSSATLGADEVLSLSIGAYVYQNQVRAVIAAVQQATAAI